MQEFDYTMVGRILNPYKEDRVFETRFNNDMEAVFGWIQGDINADILLP